MCNPSFRKKSCQAVLHRVAGAGGEEGRPSGAIAPPTPFCPASDGAPAAAMDRYHHLLVLRHLDAPSRAAAMNMILAEKQPDAEVDVAEEYVTMAEFAHEEKAVITTEKPVGYSRAAAPHL